ncbi:MAG: ABC transporter permease [Thermomicrobiaceae bacterium]|nr:ABC transporter permease [Thermomicrobiaceae bacterium]
MVAFLLRRLALAVPVLIGISLITFVMIFFLPADPARMYAGPHASVEAVARIRRQLGLDQPFYVQYGRYLSRVVTGDLGYSYQLQMPVTRALLSRLPYTVELTLAGIFVELLIGVPAGLIAAARRNTWLDGASMVASLAGVSSPPFWLGLLMLYVFAYKLGLFPLGGAGGPEHLVLPAVTAGLGGAGWYARMMRASTLEVLDADYVRTARAKGLREGRVLTRHVLRNAINPIVTMAGMDIPWFVGGVVLVETVFGWPGIGRLMVDAILKDDVPLILGAVTFTALLVVVSSILVDIAQAVLDPRVRLR